jgi:hypothetical protein
VADQSRDPFIDQIAAELRRPVRLDPRFDDRVMAALDAPEVIQLHPGRQARRPWLVRPWTVRVSPIGAFAAAAALAGVIAFGAWQLRPIDQVQVASQPIGDSGLLPVANSDAQPLVVQQFTFYRKDVKSLSLVGQFNDWDESATPMTEVSKGVWTVSLALRPGVYEYQFIVDGTKRETDPSMPKVQSDFGSPNSVVTVSPKVPQ